MIRPRYLSHLVCVRCGRIHPPQSGIFLCDCRPNRGSDLGSLDAVYDYAALGRDLSPQIPLQDADSSLARWLPLLPIAARESLPGLAVGNTPLSRAPRLEERLAMAAVYVKDEGRNPTASLKDRASAIAVAQAAEQGHRILATASTGNAAAALAGLAAAAGLTAVIFVPRSAPPAKIAQLLAYGSRVLAVDGTYDQAFDLCVQACDAFGWYNRNTGLNPYMSEGKKTVSFEIAAQLGALTTPQPEDYRVPDAVFVSVGDGCIIGGVYKGFADLLALGWIHRLPRLFGVQSVGSAAIARAWQSGHTVPEPVEATTRADSINVNAPRDGIKALRAVRRSGGAYVTVTDEAILAAIPELASHTGIFAEPAGAAAYAGLNRALALGLVAPHESVVLINTGNGLKDIAAVGASSRPPTEISPELAAVAGALPRDLLE